MPTIDPRVDAYIERSKEFAKPILNHLRDLVHQACPDVQETMKWSFPHFDYKGMMCSMASFKEHCAFGFWKQSLLENAAFPAGKTAMGSFGRITSIAELPDDGTIRKLVHDAMKLNDDGVKIARAPVSKEKKEIDVPDELIEQLAIHESAAETFAKFPYSKRKST